MNTNLIVIDNFYTSPDTVRQYALQQEFNVTGNYPGKRSRPYLSDDIKNAIAYNMQFAGKITDWFNHNPDAAYSGAFQITTANDRTWIHSDFHNMWAGVLYLTPNAPVSSGTAFYRHKATGKYRRDPVDYEGYDYTKWEKFDVIGNKYNRLILFRGDLFHASLDYFGHDLDTGRLFQTFFFNTEHY
jgi:hypothetical protein